MGCWGGDCFGGFGDGLEGLRRFGFFVYRFAFRGQIEKEEGGYNIVDSERVLYTSAFERH